MKNMDNGFTTMRNKINIYSKIIQNINEPGNKNSYRMNCTIY